MAAFSFDHRPVDEADIAARTPVLADFINATMASHSLAKPPIGYSNGAIMAAALILTHPGLLGGAILFRPLSPFWDDLETPDGWYAGANYRPADDRHLTTRFPSPHYGDSSEEGGRCH